MEADVCGCVVAVSWLWQSHQLMCYVSSTKDASETPMLSQSMDVSGATGVVEKACLEALALCKELSRDGKVFFSGSWRGDQVVQWASAFLARERHELTAHDRFRDSNLVLSILTHWADAELQVIRMDRDDRARAGLSVIAADAASQRRKKLAGALMVFSRLLFSHCRALTKADDGLSPREQQQLASMLSLLRCGSAVVVRRPMSRCSHSVVWLVLAPVLVLDMGAARWARC